MLFLNQSEVQFILASASPRRKELLAELDLHPEVFPVDIDETPEGGTPPAQVEAIARRKVLAAARRHQACRDLSFKRSGQPILILASDTLVYLDDQALSKPRDRAEAQSFLKRLSGQTHQVCTAIALYLQPADHYRILCQHAITHVRFRFLSDKQIEDYLDSNEWTDKAGGYGIQGAAGEFVTGIDGEYDNVVGLPRKLLRHILRELEIRIVA